MKNRIIHVSGRLLRMVLSAVLGASVMIIVFLVVELNSRPDLKVWHKAELDEEFRADAGLTNFDQYLELEERLFEQLDERVYDGIDPEDQTIINRYHQGSLSDPGRWPTNWNRSFVMPSAAPKIGVLLLHGMSDSPYSLRSIGQMLHGRGAYVIGLRVPGHGQAPSGLLDVEWEDMAAAVRLAMAELKEKSAGSPLFIIGYSNGGALGVQYSLDALGDSDLALVDGLVMLSPAIGISKLAAFAKWQERLGHLLGMEKLAWNALLPEYDPWKYGSFALNAAIQAYRITQQIQKQLDSRSADGSLVRMPPVLAFQSVVDATITAPALVQNFFARLPAHTAAQNDARHGHELVLFDINRDADIHSLLKQHPSAWIEPMLFSEEHTFALTLVGNRSDTDRQLDAYSRAPGSALVEVCETGLLWPEGVYSLSHVALPFPPDDPIYGQEKSASSPGVFLGNAALRGERSVLLLPATDLLRLRYNPFHSYMSQRILSFVGLEASANQDCKTLVPTPTASDT
jgi:alpha-beta hydrolase superfamily lysophospholipase